MQGQTCRCQLSITPGKATRGVICKLSSIFSALGFHVGLYCMSIAQLPALSKSTKNESVIKTVTPTVTTMSPYRPATPSLMAVSKRVNTSDVNASRSVSVWLPLTDVSPRT